MQQLFVRNTATTVFFQDDVTMEDIIDWISERIWTNDDNFLNLCDPSSCNVTVESYLKSNEFRISGDEDYIGGSVEAVTPVL